MSLSVKLSIKMVRGLIIVIVAWSSIFQMHSGLFDEPIGIADNQKSTY